jgi:hypothetical protein
VLILNTEDGPGDTIRPRLETAGADLNHCHFLLGEDLHGDFWPNLAEHLPQLAQAIEDTQAALVWIDPLFGSLGPAVDAYKDPDVRTVLAPLKRVLDTSNRGQGCAAVLVMHLSKGKGSLLNRVQGSVAFRNFARTVLIAAPDPNEEKGNLLVTAKGNLSQPVPALKWSVNAAEADPAYATVAWNGESDLTQDDLEDAPTTRWERQKEAEIKEWVLQRITTPLTTKDIKSELKDAGYEWREVEGPMRRLGYRQEMISRFDTTVQKWVPPGPKPKPASNVVPIRHRIRKEFDGA